MSSASIDPIISAAISDAIPLSTVRVFAQWSVTQVVITKQASKSSSSSSSGPTTAIHGITVQEDGGSVKAPEGRRLSKMGTSKIHKFKPSVSLVQALKWLSEYGASDSTVLFENDCCLLFEKGKFTEFDDVRDEDEEATGSGGGNDGGDHDDDDDDASSNKRVVEGEKFHL